MTVFNALKKSRIFKSRFREVGTPSLFIFNVQLFEFKNRRELSADWTGVCVRVFVCARVRVGVTADGHGCPPAVGVYLRVNGALLPRAAAPGAATAARRLALRRDRGGRGPQLQGPPLRAGRLQQLFRPKAPLPLTPGSGAHAAARGERTPDLNDQFH